MGEGKNNEKMRTDESSSSSLSPFTIGQLTKHNIAVVKAIHEATLPIEYSENLYEALPRLYKFSRLAYMGEVPVGVIVCRLEKMPNPISEKKSNRLYLMTLAVLEPYRRLGCGTFLLDYIIRLASSRNDLEELSLHVWTANTLAIDFYKRHSFECVGEEKDYYEGIEPPDAFYLSLSLPAKPILSKEQTGYDASVHNVHLDP